MSGQYSLSIKSQNILRNQTIMPRLYFSHELLCKTIHILEDKNSELKKTNKILLLTSNPKKVCIKTFENERKISISLETLKFIQKKLNSFSRIDEIPKIFPPLVPVIRTVSANLFDIHPKSSQLLSELSVHLGSIALDSASITKANFDFSQTSIESSLLLDKGKLIADSKISKQYPHLNFF